MKKLYNVSIWYDNRIEVDSMEIEAESEDDAAVEAMMKGNYGKEYYPSIDLV